MLRRVQIPIARRTHCANACTDVEDEPGERWQLDIFVSELCLITPVIEFPKSFTVTDNLVLSVFALEYFEDQVHDSTVKHLRCWVRLVDVKKVSKGIVGWFWHKISEQF